MSRRLQLVWLKMYTHVTRWAESRQWCFHRKLPGPQFTANRSTSWRRKFPSNRYRLSPPRPPGRRSPRLSHSQRLWLLHRQLRLTSHRAARMPRRTAGERRRKRRRTQKVAGNRPRGELCRRCVCVHVSLRAWNVWLFYVFSCCSWTLRIHEMTSFSSSSEQMMPWITVDVLVYTHKHNNQTAIYAGV